MPFDFSGESARTREMVEEFKKAYVGGADDLELSQKAIEIFGRIKTEDNNTRHGSEEEKAVRKLRKEFAKTVRSICVGRGPLGSSELGKCYAKHKGLHPEDDMPN